MSATPFSRLLPGKDISETAYLAEEEVLKRVAKLDKAHEELLRIPSLKQPGKPLVFNDETYRIAKELNQLLEESNEAGSRDIVS